MVIYLWSLYYYMAGVLILGEKSKLVGTRRLKGWFSGNTAWQKRFDPTIQFNIQPTMGYIYMLYTKRPLGYYNNLLRFQCGDAYARDST